MKYSFLVAAWLIGSLLAGTVHADLKAYVDRPDDSFGFRIVDEHDLGGSRAVVAELISQTWQDIEWRHWLSIIVPAQIEHRDHALLLIAGGNNGEEAPEFSSSVALALAQIAEAVKAPVVVVQQVPNQPLWGGLREDAMIAETFDRFMVEGDPDVPLLLPMVKSAVRAMDAAEAIGRDRLGLDLRQFVVTGASKRGWTTWLLAAVDPRVSALAPMVIDVLNIPAQMKQQVATYGEFSQKINDYTERNIQHRLSTEEGRELNQIVDPFAYRELLTMPKLVLLGTNDPYWTVDSANLYFPMLPGAKHLSYVPNTGHGLGLQAVPTLIAFISRSLEGQTLPDMRWEHRGDHELAVEWDHPGGIATLWHATSDTRDFRDATWKSQALQGSGSVSVSMAAPDQGYAAWFVEVRFPGSPMPYTLSTLITVLPQ